MLGRVACGGDREAEIRKNKEEESLLKSTFPDMDFSDEEDIIEDEEDIIFYIWDCNKTIYDIYCVLLNYMTGEFYTIDSSILLALIKDKYLPITDTLRRIPYIHNAYISSLLPVRSDTNGDNREDT